MWVLVTCTYNLCLEQKYEKSKKKKSTENCHFTAVKIRCLLHGRVFVMEWSALQFYKVIRFLCKTQKGTISSGKGLPVIELDSFLYFFSKEIMMQISSINKFCHFDKTRQIFVLSR